MDGSNLDKEGITVAKRRFLAVWTAVGAILLAGVVVYLLNVLSGPVGILIWTVIIVFCLRGPVNWLEGKGINRAVGTTLAYVLMFVILGLVGMLMFSPAFGLGGQFSDLAANVPTYMQSVVDWGNDVYARYAHVFEDATVREWLTDIQSAALAWASGLAKESATGVVAAGSTIVNGMVIIGFALVVAFWILMELPALGRECARLISPHRQEDMHMFHAAFTRVMGGYIKGTLLQCAIIGIACGVLFGIVGIPNAAALGGITGILNIIPIIGPWLGGAAAALVGIFASPWSAFLALVGTIAIQQAVYTFVSPKIMANSVDIHPALTLIALMVGSAVGGAMNGLVGSLVGMLASIPAVAVMKSVFVYYFEKRTGRRIVSPDGVFFKGAPSAGDGIDPMADATSPHPHAFAGLERGDEEVPTSARTCGKQEGSAPAQARGGEARTEARTREEQETAASVRTGDREARTCGKQENEDGKK